MNSTTVFQSHNTDIQITRNAARKKGKIRCYTVVEILKQTNLLKIYSLSIVMKDKKGKPQAASAKHD